VTVWSGFSTKWYGALFADPQMLGAAWLSASRSPSSRRHRAACSARSAPSRWSASSASAGRTVLAGAVSAPLVMPDVITGLALLLLFVAMEVDSDRLAPAAAS
jgi:putrescine transport system permease protein